MILRKGTFSVAEKKIFYKLTRLLDIAPAQIEEIKQKVRTKVFRNQDLSSADLRNYLNKLRDNLCEILDPLIVDDLIYSLAEALNIKIKEIERLTRLSIPQHIRDEYVVHCNEFSLDRSFYYEDTLFSLSSLMSNKTHDGYLKLLSLRNRGQHGKAIAWLNKTNSFDETIRLYLTARFHLECQEYDRARFLLSQSHQMGLRNDLFEEEMFFVDCAKLQFEESLVRWSKLRHLNSKSVTSKQAKVILRSLIEGLISRNMMHIAHRNLKLAEIHYGQLQSDLDFYKPLSEKCFNDFIPYFYGKRFLLIQTALAIVILYLSSINLPDIKIVCDYLLGLEVQNQLVRPTYYQYFKCFTEAFFWIALIPLIYFNLKTLKHFRNEQKCGYVTLFKNYIQVVAFSKTYHFARNKYNKSRLFITKDQISLAGNFFLRAFPFWPGVNYIHGKNLISGKNATVPLFGVTCGQSFSTQVSLRSRNIIKPINRIGIRICQISETFVRISQVKTFLGVYVAVGLLLPTALYVTHLNEFNQNHIIVFWISWISILILTPLYSKSLSKNISQLGILIHFNKPRLLIGLLMTYYLSEHYYPLGFEGIIPTTILVTLICLILFNKSRHSEQQELLANFYRDQVFRKLSNEPKILFRDWSHCHHTLTAPLPIVQQSLTHTHFNNNLILVRSLFGLILTVHCWVTKGSPIVIHSSNRYRRSDIGDGAFVTSVSADHLRQTLYALDIPNIFQSSKQSVRQIQPLQILLPTLVASYGLWLFLLQTDFKDHKYENVNLDISNLLLLTNKNLFRKDKQVDELFYLPEQKKYKIHFEDDNREVTVVQKYDLTYGEMEDILQSSYKFTDHPLQKINTPHFIRKKGKRSNLLDLLTWYYYKNKTVSWDLFGPELENYCQAIDMQAIPYYGSYRCGFSFSDSQIAHFLRSRESIPEIFNVKLLEAALTADGSLLQIMEPIHQRNEQLALASIKTYKAPWKFIDEKLRKNPSFIFAALQINGRILSYLSKGVRGDRDYVLAALKQDPATYKHMDSELWDDLGIVNLVLQEDGLSLKFVSEKFRNRKDVVVRAVKQNGLAIQYASPELRNNPQIRKIARFTAENIEFSFIPSGTLFDPLLKQNIAMKGFFISSHEIKRETFEKHLGYNPGTDQTPKHPVDSIDLTDISRFLDFLNTKSGKILYRLPTPEEWEYAARAKTKSTYFFGDDSRLLTNYAWYPFNAKGKSWPVGKKLPNPWDLYDIYGNVFERVAPFPAQYYRGKGFRLPGLASQSLVPGLCSGSFESVTLYCQPITPDKDFSERQNEIGFRVIRVLD